MCARLLFAASVISLLVLISGCGKDIGQPANPASNGSGTTDPGTTDPGTTDPGTTDPGTTDPGTTDPWTTEPGTTFPDEEEAEPKAPPVPAE